MSLTEHPIQVHRDIEDLENSFKEIIVEKKLDSNLFFFEEDEKTFIKITCSEPIQDLYCNVYKEYSLEQNRKDMKYSFVFYPQNDIENKPRSLNTVPKQIKYFFNIWIDIVSEYLQVHQKRNDKSEQTTSTVRVDRVRNTICRNIRLRDFQFLKNIQLENLSGKKEIYILGENGDGKTVLLQALMLAFKEHFAKNTARKSLVAEMLDFDKDFERASYLIELEDNTVISKTNMAYHPDVYAYGTNRGNILSETEDEYGFMTLFSPRYHLRNPVEWLEGLRGKELELKDQNKESEEQNVLTLEIAKKLLENIINSGENPKDIRIEVDLSSKEKVKFIERDTKIKFEHLSEGYRSVFIWVADLVSRLAESQPTVKKIQDFKGIVLVDEIGLHLHPKWENRIVQKLRHWFPNIQFFFTTHSPICVLGASEDAVFYRLYKEDGIAKLSEQIEYSQIKEMTANQVVTSMLFDLETPFMRHTDSSEIDTSDDYLYNRIHKKISERVKQRKEKGEVYFSDEEINAMIDEALDEETEDNEK